MKPSTIIATLCFSIGALAAPQPKPAAMPGITERSDIEKRDCYGDCLGGCGTGPGGFVIGCTIGCCIACDSC